MGKTRLDLHKELCEVLGSNNCYFSPPSKMNYPCIKYGRDEPFVAYADNIEYHYIDSWIITIIDTDPDSTIPARLKEHFGRYCSWDREYTGDNLYHFVYRLYY